MPISAAIAGYWSWFQFNPCFYRGFYYIRAMKRVLVISISLNLLFLAYAGYRKIRQPDSNISAGIKPLYPDQEAYINARKEVFERLPADTGAIVLLGNSITEEFRADEYFRGMNIKNRGIRSDRLSRFDNDRLEQIAILHPSAIILSLGVNDLKSNTPVDSATSDLLKVLAMIRARIPEAKITIESVLPTSKGYLQYNDSINLFNARAETIAKGNKLDYLNSHKYFTVNGQLDSTLTYDGLHLNGKGYDVLYSVFRNYFESK